ncbi:MAG: O-antigen ligase family protein [Chloroflexi bacterium]|nr:O-antigen ligase family protein [Chloroflexota bacterium]
MRRLSLLILSLLLVCGSLAATFGTLRLRDFELRGYVDPTKDKNLPFAVERSGVNVELMQYSEPDLSKTLERIRSANFRWIRQFAYWDEIEARQGEYDWSAWDQVAGGLREIDELEAVVVIMNSPKWAQGEDGDAVSSRSAPPHSLADFANFCREFAARYGDVIDYYQIWDEPNLGDAWGGRDPRPAEYVAMLASARDAILDADPSAAIVAAGLAPTVETAGRNISDIRYLQAMYAQGARELMDVVAGKPYGQFTSPLDRAVDENVLNFSRIIALREVMLANDDGRKPLWASNYGWNALPLDWPGDASIWGEVSVEEQTQFALQTLDRVHREMPWLGPLFLQHWQPEADPESAQWGFALLKQDGSESALLRALQTYQFPSLAQNGLYHARNSHASYSGLWQFSELGADIGKQPITDSQLSFDFFGADVAMLLREDDYFAFLYPTVDGLAPNALQKDADGRAYVFLRSNSRAPELNLVPIASNLALGNHKLHASADQGWDRWAIAGYAVSSGDLSPPYNRQITLGLLATALSLSVLAMTIATSPWDVWLPGITNLLSGLSATTHLLFTGVTSILMMLAMLWTWDSPKASILARDEVNILLAILTGGALYISESFLISLIIGLLLFVQIYHRIENGLILTLLWAPFFLYPVELHIYAFPMVEILLLISAAAGLVKLMVTIGKRMQMENAAFPALSGTAMRRITALDLAVGCLVVLALLSLLWAQHRDHALTELRTLIIEPAMFFLLLRLANPDRRTLFRLLAALLFAGVVASLYGLYDVLLASGPWPLRSVYGSPNNVGLLLGRTIPFALAMMIINLSPRLRWIAAGSLVVMLPALILTQSVGAIFLGVPAAVVTVFVGRFGRRALVPTLALGLIGLAGVFLLPQLSDGFTGLFDFTSGTNFVRLRLWESTVSILRDRPITGIGLDQFLYYFGGEYLRPDAIWDPDLSHPHNFILDFWTRLSVFGVAIFGLIQIEFWRRAYSVARKVGQRDPLLLSMTLGLSGSMAALLIHGLVDNSVFVIDLAFIFMFQLAAMMRLRQLADQFEA